MILDTLDRLSLYASLHPDIAAAAAFLQTPQCAQLDDGRYPLTQQSYVILQSYQTKPIDAVCYVTHEAFADIQVILAGQELISYAPSQGFAVQTAYDPQKDIALGSASEAAADLHMAAGMFALFLPGEAHRPSCIWESASLVRKAVVKLRMP